MELADIYNYIINCLNNNLIRSIEEINEELLERVISAVLLITFYIDYSIKINWFL